MNQSNRFSVVELNESSTLHREDLDLYTQFKHGGGKFPKANQKAHLFNEFDHLPYKHKNTHSDMDNNNDNISSSSSDSTKTNVTKTSHMKLTNSTENSAKFKRNTILRRSLGGGAICLNESPHNDDVYRQHILNKKIVDHLNYKSSTSHSDCYYRRDLCNFHLFRVTNLPAWNEMGFVIEPYMNSNLEMTGIRLVNKSTIYADNNLIFRSSIPFKSDDLIVSVNHYQLKKMDLSDAYKLVQNALKEARQYVVEFGILRPNQNSASTSSKDTADSSTMSRHSNRDRPQSFCAKKLDSCHTPLSPHQPRRTNTGHSKANSISESILRDDLNFKKRDGSTSSKESGYDTCLVKRPTMLDGKRSNRNSLSTAPHSLLHIDEHAVSQHSSNTHFKSNSFKLLTIDQPSSPVNSPTDLADNELPMSRKLSNVKNNDPNAFNTRSIGKKIQIQVRKILDGGLGFTLTSRDTKVTSESPDPVYVKKLLPDGAASRDGRLKIGDRLLLVNGVTVQSMSQILAYLRSLEPGTMVHLTVSRQSSVKKNAALIRNRAFVSRTYEYYVPKQVLNMDELLQLGINFKWSDDILLPPLQDDSIQYVPIPGLYIDSLLPNGLITCENRTTIQPGDRLVGVNGVSMDGLNSKKIIEHLKTVLEGLRNQIEKHRSCTRDSFDQSQSDFATHLNTSSISSAAGNSRGDCDRRTPIPDDHQQASLFNLSLSLTVHRYNQILCTVGRRCSTLDPLSEKFDSTSKDHKFPSADSMEGKVIILKPKLSYQSDGQPLVINDNRQRFAPRSNLDRSDSRNLSVPRRIKIESRNDNFAREGLGRRSMSEKRRGHLDPTQSEFFQTNILPNRYKMPEDVDKQYSTMPTSRRIKMQKSRLFCTNPNAQSNHPSATNASTPSTGPLKALHPKEHNPYSENSQRKFLPQDQNQATPDHLCRSRPQNSSFRHAVDRSFAQSVQTSSSTFHSSKTHSHNPTVNVNSFATLPTKPSKMTNNFNSLKHFFKIGSKKSIVFSHNNELNSANIEKYTQRLSPPSQPSTFTSVHNQASSVHSSSVHNSSPYTNSNCCLSRPTDSKQKQQLKSNHRLHDYLLSSSAGDEVRTPPPAPPPLPPRCHKSHIDEKPNSNGVGTYASPFSLVSSKSEKYRVHTSSKHVYPKLSNSSGTKANKVHHNADLILSPVRHQHHISNNGGVNKCDSLKGSRAVYMNSSNRHDHTLRKAASTVSGTKHNLVQLRNDYYYQNEHSTKPNLISSNNKIPTVHRTTHPHDDDDNNEHLPTSRSSVYSSKSKSRQSIQTHQICRSNQRILAPKM